MIAAIILLTFSLIISIVAGYSYYTNSIYEINIQLSSFKVRLFTSILWTLSILASFFPTSCFHTIFGDWSSINTMNMLASLLSYSLILFWPGYILINIIETKYYSIEIGEKITFSFIISLFINLIIISVTTFLGIYSIALIVVVLMAMNITGFLFTIIEELYTFLTKRQNTDRFYWDKVSINVNNFFIVILTMTYLVLGVFFIQTSFVYCLYGDMISHHGSALYLLDGGSINGRTGYYPWYWSLLAELFYISKIPTINSFVLLSIAAPIIYVLSFYSAARLFFPDKSIIPAVATYIFSTFGGFEWIDAIAIFFNNPASSLTNVVSYVMLDTVYGLIYSGFSSFYYFMPTSIGLISIFGVLCLYNHIKKHDILQSPRLVILLIFCATVSLLFHGPEFFFIEILLMGFLVYSDKGIPDSLFPFSSLILSLALSTILVVLIRSYPTSIFLYGFIGTFALMFVISLLMKITRSTLFNSIIAIKSNTIFFVIRQLGIILIISGITLFIFTWSKPFPFFIYYYEIVPWYVYTIRLGLLILIPSIVLWKFRKLRYLEIKPFILSAIFLILFAKFTSYLNIIGIRTYLEARILPAIFIGLSVALAGIFSSLVTIIQRKRIVVTIISILLLSGSFTTVFQVQYWSDIGQSSYTNVSSEVLEGLQFIRNNIDSTHSVVSLSYRLYPLIYGFTSARVVPISWFTYGGLSGQHRLSDFEDPLSIILFLNAYHVKYIVQDHQESAFISPSSALLDLLPLLPVVLSNQYITIYYIPPLQEASPSSRVSILISGFSNDASGGSPLFNDISDRKRIMTLLYSFSSSNLSCWYKPTFSPVNGTVLVLPTDSDQSSIQENDYSLLFDWLAKGNTLVVFGNGLSGPIFSMLNLTRAGTANVTNICVLGSIMNLPHPIAVPLLVSLSSDTEVLSTYSDKDNNTLSSAILKRNIGRGSILYYSIDPIFALLNESPEKQMVHSIIHTLLDSHINSDTDSNSFIAYFNTFAETGYLEDGFVDGSINLYSNYQLISDTIYFPTGLIDSEIIFQFKNESTLSHHFSSIDSLILSEIGSVNIIGNSSGVLSESGLCSYSLLSASPETMILINFKNNLESLLSLHRINSSSASLIYTNIKTVKIFVHSICNVSVLSPRIECQNGVSFHKSYISEAVIKSLDARNGTSLYLEGKVNFTLFQFNTVAMLKSVELSTVPKFDSVDLQREWLQNEYLLNNNILLLFGLSLGVLVAILLNPKNYLKQILKIVRKLKVKINQSRFV